MIEIKIYGETGDDTIAELRKLAAALSGGSDPQPAAAKATRSKPAETSTPTPAAPVSAPPATAAASVPSTNGVAGETASSAGQTATIAASPTEAEAPVSEADIIAAANAAVATIGAAGPAKIKAHIAANFTQADGKPGTIKLTRPEQRGALLADLQKIARKELVLP